MGIKAPRFLLHLSFHPHARPPLNKQTDKNRDDPKAADKFVLVNKAKIFLSDDVSPAAPASDDYPPFKEMTFSFPCTHLSKPSRQAKREKLAEKKRREAERDRRNKKR